MHILVAAVAGVLTCSRSRSTAMGAAGRTTELRCYMRDPDGYLIEVGQTTTTAGRLDLYT